MRNKKLAFSFEVGEPIDDESGTYRRHRLSCELNVAYLVVGGAAVLVIGTVLWLALANGSTIQNASLKPNQQFHQNFQTSTTDTPDTNQEMVDADVDRLDFVRNMTRNVWNDLLQYYSKYEINNQTWHNGTRYHYSLGFIVMRSMSTLWVENLIEEFNHAKTWIKPLTTFFVGNFSYDFVSVKYAITEYVGPLESCFALTGDVSFFNEAQKAVNLLKNRYQLDEPYVNLYHVAPNLEYRYMADLTQDTQLDTILEQYRSMLKNWPKINGLYSLERRNSHTSLNLAEMAYRSRPFYSYLIKSYIQSNYTDYESNSMFNQAIEALVNDGLIVKSNSDKHRKDIYCYLGTLFGLSAWAKNQSRVDGDAALMKKHLNWAVHFTDKCHDGFSLNYTQESKSNYFSSIQKEQFFSPHLAESYFILYRLTGDLKYREYAWELVQNINNYLTEVGLFIDMYDIYEHEFLDSTIKYLYLTFAEKNLLSLDEWVFNNDGQPLPICGHNRMYPGVKCGGKLGVHQ